MYAATRDLVRRRAKERCEYCRIHQAYCYLTHHIEHVVARQHGGSDDPDNLALACHFCNLRKGTNLSGIDPETGLVAPLFNPRKLNWDDHFVLREARIEGVACIGRTTVQLLGMNDERRLELRQEILAQTDSIGYAFAE